MTPTAIELRDVFRIYPTPRGGNVALQGLTLDVEAGEVVVVSGPSGAGKTTLLRLLAFLDAPSAGRAVVLGEEPARLSAREAAAFRARALGLVDQHYGRSLSPDLDLRENVGLQLALAGAPAARRDARARALLERVGLADRAGERPALLSGGERQRVAVCAATAHKPRLLLADEPAGELDAANAAVVYRLLAELARDEGTTTVVVSHDQTAERYADRVVRLRDGRLVEEARRGGAGALVVGRGGWVRLPEALVERAMLGDRATVDARPGEVVLSRPAGAPPAPRAAPRPQRTDPRERGVIPAAELRGVDVRYRQGRHERLVISALSARLDAGRLALLVGRSGSGKTTLLRLLAGLARPSAGEVLVDGNPLTGLTREQLAELRRRRIGWVAQETGLVPFLTATENVVLALDLRDAPGDRAVRARAALCDLGLEHRLHDRVTSLSAGEAQRVAVARALAAEPQLLLVDEPTARLDEANARAAAALLARAAHERGCAVVCATHDPILVEHGDDRLELETVAEVVSRP